MLLSAAAAVCAEGLCGERAFEKTEKEGTGTSSLRLRLIDQMSLLTPKKLTEGMKIEQI